MRNKILSFCLLASVLAFGQTDSSVANHVWAKVGYKTKLPKQVSLTTSGQYRAKYSDQDHDQWLTNFDFKKELSKKWDLGLELRHYFIFDNQGGNQGTFQRFRAQVNAQQNIQLPLGELHFRYAVQQRWIVSGSGSNKFVARLRGEYDLPIKNFKWDPTFQAELLNVSSDEPDQSLRLGISTSNKIAGIKLKFGYFHQRDFSTVDLNRNVLQMGLRF
jgi:hypothetical protein